MYNHIADVWVCLETNPANDDVLRLNISIREKHVACWGSILPFWHSFDCFRALLINLKSISVEFLPLGTSLVWLPRFEGSPSQSTCIFATNFFCRFYNSLLIWSYCLQSQCWAHWLRGSCSLRTRKLFLSVEILIQRKYPPASSSFCLNQSEPLTH